VRQSFESDILGKKRFILVLYTPMGGKKKGKHRGKQGANPAIVLLETRGPSFRGKGEEGRRAKKKEIEPSTTSQIKKKSVLS